MVKYLLYALAYVQGLGECEAYRHTSPPNANTRLHRASCGLSRELCRHQYKEQQLQKQQQTTDISFASLTFQEITTFESYSSSCKRLPARYVRYTPCRTCTTTVSPPAHLSFSSIKFAIRKQLVKASARAGWKGGVGGMKDHDNKKRRGKGVGRAALSCSHVSTQNADSHSRNWELRESLARLLHEIQKKVFFTLKLLIPCG